MNRKRPELRLAALGAVAFILATAAASGAVPKVSVKAEAKLEGYSKVYVAPIKNDLAKLDPRILTRLQKAGFEAETLKLENLPFASQGTGFVLTPQGHVLTCAHVVGTEAQATLWIEGVRYPGRVLTLDTNLDAALIKVEGNHPEFRYLTITTDTNYHLGQEVFTLGYPMADVLGKNARLNKGLISATSGMGDVPWKVQISAEVQPGNSGGPLLTQAGDVVGMVDSSINPLRFMVQTGGDLPQNVNFAIKNYPLREFLDSSRLSLPATPQPAIKGGFEEMAKSLVLIRGGVVDEKRLQERPLLCRCSYLVGINKHLVRLRLQFLDPRKMKIVLSAELDQESFASADKVMDALFAEVSDKFYPDRANPFRSNKAKGKSGKS